jgi:hypothetical protein
MERQLVFTPKTETVLSPIVSAGTVKNRIQTYIRTNDVLDESAEVVVHLSDTEVILGKFHGEEVNWE